MRNRLIVVCGALILWSCGSRITSVDSPEAIAQQEANNGFSTGRVTTNYAGDGCPLLIRVEGVDGLYLIPIALEEKYKQDGLRLTFKYRPSRASSGDCRRGSPAVLEEITVLPEVKRSKPKGG